jgi:hypothetical protein
MLSPHQARTLRKFDRLGPDWGEAKISGVGNEAWNLLIALGFLEEKPGVLRLTERGRRVVEGKRY